MFPATARPALSLRLHARGEEALEIELVSRAGVAALRLRLAAGRPIEASDGAGTRAFGPLADGRWVRLAVRAALADGRYDLDLDGQPLARGLGIAHGLAEVERVVFRTGPARMLPTTRTEPYRTDDLRGADEPVAPSSYHLHDIELVAR